MQVAIYIHIPFCQARCTYCDFNTYAELELLIPAYVAAINQEIKLAGEHWGYLTVPTIYFGGGTPSLLSSDLLAKILHALRSIFHVLPDAEITIEANPGTINADQLGQMRTLGVNRLSLGIQSSCDDELDLLGRIHNWAQATETVEAARASGFDNLNLDFMFGLPGQTLIAWKKTVEAALAFAPEHLSLYCLSIEENTPLAKRISESQIEPPDPDLAADMYELAEKTLLNTGFLHYEISNWAKSNSHMSKHNLIYWRNEPWLGIGAGAHSWLNKQRWANVYHPQKYITELEQGNSPIVEKEPIDQQLEMGETMMMGLRLAEGVDNARFRARFGVGLETAFETEFAELQHLGLLIWDGHAARLTSRGRLLGNQVFMRFV
ncbi:MAG: radical SAM family heme chaperone HemW [Chloroflexi bacterium]|nr:radical SAM family heme chaperone HemW [Chloroflexota bacterium]